MYDEVIKILEKAGVIYKNKLNPDTKVLKIYIKYFGKPNDKLRNEIINTILDRKNFRLVNEIDNSDLALFIRINASFRDLLDKYSKSVVPHILIDLGYANNISIGPIVFEGTACVGCYAGKLVKNWGDPMPPSTPAVTNQRKLISSFILERLEEFISCGNCPDLINGVWNYNTSTHASDYNKVYKQPWCSFCGNRHDNPKIILPWIKELNHD